jgi:ubiquinone/menaquinone biosynthesis C-methylase UbiE
MTGRAPWNKMMALAQSKEMHMIEKTLHEIEHKAWSQQAGDYDALFAAVSMQAIDGILASLGPLQGKGHLDVACGTGHLVAAASQCGAVSEGIDFAQAMVDAAKTNYPSENYQVADAANLPHADRSFDAVTCAFGLSHMENPQAAVDETFRVLKAGGRFAFTLWYSAEDGGEGFSIVKAAVARYVNVDLELPARWVQLRFADEQACQALAAQAGFESPVFKRLPIVWRTTSAQSVVDTFEKLSVRTKLIIDRLPPSTQRQIQDYIRSEAEARRVNGVISLAWPALLTVVQKPR